MKSLTVKLLDALKNFWLRHGARIGGWSLMKKYDLLRSGDAIIRVLEVQGDRVLVIDCIKRTMPVWVDAAELESYSECTSGELSQVTEFIPSDVDALDADQRKVMYKRYTMMLKEKYCNALGVLAEEYPSYYQFRYFYRKPRNLQNFYISRDGLKNYQRNNRPLTGEGVQEFAPAVGTGMFDATVCDIYLVNDAGSLVGRLILTACVDAYSGLCCGYFLLWEGGVYSLRGLMLNIIADKVGRCQNYGISIQKEDWDCDMLPAMFVTDMGSEYTSATFEQIAELGVRVVNLPSYRPELKGLVEKFFDLIQESYKKHLKGKGVIEPDYQERGAHDYRKDACLTMTDFERIILHCIIYYNSQRIIESFPYTEDMIAAQVKPYVSQIWNWGKGVDAYPPAEDYRKIQSVRVKGKQASVSL